MVIGIILMIFGAVLITRNRGLAVLLGREPRVDQWGFMTSAVRQNIALMGTIFFVGGLVFFVLL